MDDALFSGDDGGFGNLMAGDPDSGFCENLHDNDANVARDAEGYTYEHFPDITGAPPLLLSRWKRVVQPSSSGRRTPKPEPGPGSEQRRAGSANDVNSISRST